MKKLLTILFIAVVFQINGQSFNLDELAKMNNMKIDDFDSYVVKKGFVFDKTKIKKRKEIAVSLETTYEYRKDNKKVSTIAKEEYYNGLKEINYTFLSTELYLSLKNDLKLGNYILLPSKADTLSETIKDVNFLEFDNDTNNVSFSTLGGHGDPFYSVTLRKKVVK